MENRKRIVILITVLILVSAAAVFFCVFEPENSPDASTVLTIQKPAVEMIRTEKSTDEVILYAWTKEPGENLCSTVKQRYPIIDTDRAIHVYDAESSGSEGYWFPLFSQGRIVSIVFASELSDGRIVTGYTVSGCEELNTLAQKTSPSAALLLLAYQETLFYVIGETAYCFDEFTLNTELTWEYLEIPNVHMKTIQKK